MNYSFINRNLSYAISAQLRRNIIAFHAGEHAYLAFEQSTGTEPDPRKEGLP
jgi:hypothetical protein